MWGEVMGMACSHLRSARCSIAQTIAADTGGKHHELVLHAIDGACGTLDPAFDAHGLPIWMWALAHWQEWVPNTLLDEAVLHADRRVLSLDGKAKWRIVAEIAAAVVASASRIGWRFQAGQTVVSDDGCQYDFRLDPPVVILQAVHRSVRRWRLGRIELIFPQLVPSRPDVSVLADRSGLASDGFITAIHGFEDTLDSLLSAKARSTCEVFADWEPKHRCYLRSALIGAQWPQARIAAVPGWSDDNRCQLCRQAIGTLGHRLVCSALMPHGGWQAPPPECATTAAMLSQESALLLAQQRLLSSGYGPP